MTPFQRRIFDQITRLTPAERRQWADTLLAMNEPRPEADSTSEAETKAWTVNDRRFLRTLRIDPEQ